MYGLHDFIFPFSFKVPAGLSNSSNKYYLLRLEVSSDNKKLSIQKNPTLIIIIFNSSSTFSPNTINSWQRLLHHRLYQIRLHHPKGPIPDRTIYLLLFGFSWTNSFFSSRTPADSINAHVAATSQMYFPRKRCFVHL